MNANWLVAVILVLTPICSDAAERLGRPTDPPAIRAFLSSGLGTLHEQAPERSRDFARLVGVWDVEQELRKRDGTWAGTWPGVWVWKHAIDGFAVQDLFYQPKDALPPYMASFGRDYLLTAMRIYDVRSKRWNVAWMANGAGLTPGLDFGTFEASSDDGRLVMTSPGSSEMGEQRVVFSEIDENSFLWESEFSSDGGETWQTVMHVKAKRRGVE